MKAPVSVRRALVVGVVALAFATPFLKAQAPAQQMSAAPAAATASNGGKPITIEDYARFKRLGGASISADGKWMLYTVTPNDGDGTMFVQSLDTATKHEIPRGTGASFSDTSRWVVARGAADRTRWAWRRWQRRRCADSAGHGTRQRRLARHEPSKCSRLTTGTKTSFPAVASFSFHRRRMALMRPQGRTRAGS
jgi:hypothetical protein